jgi:hypothetical protein
MTMKKPRLEQGDSRIPRDQAWYWTKEWQEVEREADEAIRSGTLSPVFETAEEAIRYLHRHRV